MPAIPRLKGEPEPCHWERYGQARCFQLVGAMAALAFYGRHLPDCSVQPGLLPIREGGCSCGLVDALRKTGRYFALGERVAGDALETAQRDAETLRGRVKLALLALESGDCTGAEVAAILRGELGE